MNNKKPENRKLLWLQGADQEIIKALPQEKKDAVIKFWEGFWGIDEGLPSPKERTREFVLEQREVNLDRLWKNLYLLGYFEKNLTVQEHPLASKRYQFILWQSSTNYPVSIGTEARKILTSWLMEELGKTLVKPSKLRLLTRAVELWALLPDNLFNLILSMERDRMESVRKQGGDNCPVCLQLAKEYKVKININMVVFLKSLVINYLQKKSEGGEGWIHYKELKFSSRNYPYVANWGLAETRRDPAGKKRTSGEWKPTQKGIDFVFKRCSVPKYCYTYNGQTTGFDVSQQVNISEVFEDGTFDLSELMALFPDEDRDVKPDEGKPHLRMVYPVSVDRE